MRTISLAAGLAMLALIPAASAGAAGTADLAGGAAAPVTATTPPSIATTAPATSGAASTPTATSPTGGALSLSKVPGASGSAQHPASTASSSKLSTGAILAAVLGGLIALACLVWGAFRWSAVEPRWTLPLRHSVAEAGFRASAVWAEFTDWIRLGH